MSRSTFLAAVMASVLTLGLTVASLALFSGALAASSGVAIPQPQTAQAYFSLSSFAFQPYSSATIAYRRDFTTQLLSLNTATRQIEGQNNWFMTPLRLPDHSRLTGVTVYGQDFDRSGWIEVALWRCAHLGDETCINLGLWQSGETSAGGSFNSGRISLNEVIDNQAFSYTLATRLYAVNNSGLRSVLLEVTAPGDSLAPGSGNGAGVSRTEQWTLANRGVTTQLASNLSSVTTVQICSYGSSTADVEIQYNGQMQTLRPGNCTRVSGFSTYTVKNVGLYGHSASGTIEFLD